MSCTHSLQSHLDSTPSRPSAARRIWNVVLKQCQSSRMHGSLSTSFRPSFGSARALLTRIPLSFRRPHPDTNDTTESQQTQPPRTVEVAAVRDKQVCQSSEDTFPSSPFSFQSLFVARRPERDKAKRLPPQKVSSQTQTLSQSSQNQPAVTSTSATAPIPGTSTTTSSAETAQSRPIPFWARVVLFLCCVVPAPIS